MKLELPELTLNQKLTEFDFWITSTLGEIKNANKFRTEINAIANAIEILGSRTNNFFRIDDLTIDIITDSTIIHLKAQNNTSQKEILLGVISFLFLVTGKSDNNCKCQFPVYLRNEKGVNKLQKKKRKTGNIELIETSLPRVINDDTVANIVISLTNYPIEQARFLSLYFQFILKEEQSVESLWAYGNTYFQLKEKKMELAFLLPLVVYRVRGSVSATGGHEPEIVLRKIMREWGLLPDIDFNINDVIIGEHKEKIRQKTRAYDFVLPYKVENWESKLFIQSQFYAGDSGSVSHKNVDQIKTSRNYVKTKISDPIFLEYVDGAGYFGSLNGDLKKILEMEDTFDFFQVRTSPIKLRYHLQKIGFITPLEYIHALIIEDYKILETTENLIGCGYAREEVDRIQTVCLKNGIIFENSEKYTLSEGQIEMPRLYYLLDLIVLISKERTYQEKACIYIAGCGDNFGASFSEIALSISEMNNSFSNIWEKDMMILCDLQVLLERGWVIQK